MNPINVRNLPPDVAKAIRQKAKRDRLSLNRAVVELLEQATGVERPKQVLHHDLDRFAGVWTQADFDEFMQSLREQRRVDPEMWK